jgi:hypothetical protein
MPSVLSRVNDLLCDILIKSSDLTTKMLRKPCFLLVYVVRMVIEAMLYMLNMKLLLGYSLKDISVAGESPCISQIVDNNLYG